MIQFVVPRTDRLAISVYLVCTFSLSSIFYFLIIRSGHVGGGAGAYAAALMWCPGASALLTCSYLRRSLDSLGWKWGKTRYQAVSYLIPLGYAIVTYGFVWLTGLSGVPNKEFVDGATKDFGLGAMPAWASILLSFLFTATTGVITDCATTMGEEIGWRGFLVPELFKRHGFAGTAVISGLIWAVWHFPILLFADYHAPTPTWYYLPIFILTLPLISFVLTWMRLKSGSLWTGVILHASHNTFMQTFFQPLTIDTRWTRYVAGEFGVALLVVAALMAAYFWTRRGELMPTAVTD
jgi:membrane protease YdiL (CAAX protease family)